MRILLAEDERSLSRALVAILTHSGYEVDPVYDGQEALEYGLSGYYDCMVFDIMMPKMDGCATVKKLRDANVSTPIIMLTAKSETDDKVQCLDGGADDYMTKPFETKELLARIRAVARRKEEYVHTVLTCGNIMLNSSTYELSSPTGSLRLMNREFQMLEMLMRGKGMMISSEQFMSRIWGNDSDADSNVVWVYISYLRKKLSALDADISIKTARGVGYYLEELL